MSSNNRQNPFEKIATNKNKIISDKEKMSELNKMSEESIKNGSTIKTKLYKAFAFYLKLTIGSDIIISAGVVCNNPSKFNLVCYTKQRLNEEQINAVGNFLNICLKEKDTNNKWNDFDLEIFTVQNSPIIQCHIYAKIMSNISFFS